MSKHNLDLLVEAARLLKPLLGELVFVGGSCLCNVYPAFEYTFGALVFGKTVTEPDWRKEKVHVQH